MVPKISRGQGFRGALNYILDEGRKATGEKKPELVAGNLDGRDARTLAAELATVRALRPDVTRPVWHCSLSLPEGARLTPAQWQAVVSDYLQEMGFSDKTPFVAVRHQDTAHDHVHIVASRIDLDGRVWHGKWEARRAIEACKRLERRHGLQLTPGLGEARAERKAPTSAETRRAERTGTDAPRVRLRGLIDAALHDRPDLETFAARLTAQGVEVRANVARTGRMNGFSFAVDGVAFKGSDLGKAYTWNGLQARGLTAARAPEQAAAPATGPAQGETMHSRDIDSDRTAKAAAPEAPVTDRAGEQKATPTPDPSPARAQPANDNRPAVPPRPPTVAERTQHYRAPGRYDALKRPVPTEAQPVQAETPLSPEERRYQYQGQIEDQLRQASVRVHREQRESRAQQHEIESRKIRDQHAEALEGFRRRATERREEQDRADPRAQGWQRLGLWLQGKAQAHDAAHAQRAAQRQQQEAKTVAHLQRQQEAMRRDLPDRQRAEAEQLREQQEQKRQAQERAFITDRARQDIRLTPAQEQAVKDDPQSRAAYESGLNLRAVEQARSGGRQQGRPNGHGHGRSRGRSPMP